MRNLEPLRMTSYERVRRAVEFDRPDRIPLFKGQHADIGQVGYRPAADFRPDEDGLTEWGVLWRSLNPERGDQGQVARHPLADWSAFDDYTFPDAHAPGRFDEVAEAVGRLRERELFVLGNLRKGPMHLLDDLRGFEAYLMDLAAEPERIELLLEGIFGFLHGLVDRWAGAGVDGVFLVDDQAIQSGPLFSMDLWRKHFKPRYSGLFDHAHALGLKVVMHACGHLGQHLPELAEAGVDLIDNKQPALWMDDSSVADVRGKVAFSSCLDIQSAMQTIAIKDIDAEVARLVQTLSTPQGGFIATFYHQSDLAIPPDKQARMLDAFRRYIYK